MIDESAEGESAFGFSGGWREYAPIAFTNLLLTIVTLGIYTFWARARTRRYLWSRTRFIDDRLEWTGTGLELFIGYLIAIVVFFVPLGVLQFIIQGVVMRGHPGAAVLMGAIIYLGLIYLIGVAIFRALRYRLSRTLWHGIRGGSDDQGFAYGWQYFWRTIVGYLAIGLMVPWSMTTLWNRRWGAMSFGSEPFEAQADWRPVIGRYLLFYALPIALFVLVLIAVAFAAAAGGTNPGAAAAVMVVVAVLGFYGLMGLIAAAFYAAYARETVGHTHWAGLDFSFDARTIDWIKFVLGSFFLVLFTLGIGALFLGYRNWRFMTDHMQAYGTLDLDRLGQSTTRAPTQGEGLLDAFDMGAF